MWAGSRRAFNPFLISIVSGFEFSECPNRDDVDHAPKVGDRGSIKAVERVKSASLKAIACVKHRNGQFVLLDVNRLNPIAPQIVKYRKL